MSASHTNDEVITEDIDLDGTWGTCPHIGSTHIVEEGAAVTIKVILLCNSVHYTVKLTSTHSTNSLNHIPRYSSFLLGLTRGVGQ